MEVILDTFHSHAISDLAADLLGALSLFLIGASACVLLPALIA